MRCLVTGASGSVGSRIVARLLEDGHEVTALVRATSNLSLLDRDRVLISVGDMTDPASLRRAVEGADWVFHAAAPVDDWVPNDLFHRINVEGTRSLAEACNPDGLKRLVFISSINVYGLNAADGTNEASPRLGGDHPYGASKIETEDLLLQAHRDRGLPVTILQPANVWGPTAQAWTLRPIRKLLDGKVWLIDGGAGAVNPIYVDNLADIAVRSAGMAETVGETYIVTDGHRDLTFRDFFGAYCRMLGIPPVTRSLPRWAAMTVAAGAEGAALLSGKKPFITRFALRMLTKHCWYDVRKLESTFGAKRRYGFEEGMEKTREWLKEVGVV